MGTWDKISFCAGIKNRLWFKTQKSLSTANKDVFGKLAFCL